MGLFDYLLFGALLNSLWNSNRESYNNHSNFSNDNYNCGYHNGYDDACLDHDDFDCDCSDNCGCDDDGYFNF